MCDTFGLFLTGNMKSLFYGYKNVDGSRANKLCLGYHSADQKRQYISLQSEFLFKESEKFLGTI